MVSTSPSINQEIEFELLLINLYQMRPNKLRSLLNAGQPTLGTRVHSVWPDIVEALGHCGIFDYVEFLAEYAPFDLFSLDNFCRAAELYGMSSIIKVDPTQRTSQAQRGIGAGFQAVLFTDIRTAEDARDCVLSIKPDTPGDGGTFSVAMRRFTYMGYGGSSEYVDVVRDSVVLLMIEKQSAVDNLDEILAVDGIDMIQWGPADYSMSIGRPGDKDHPEVKAVERMVIDMSLNAGVLVRAEINQPDEAKYYQDLGVRHFSLGIDMNILFNWWRDNGDVMRKLLDS